MIHDMTVSGKLTRKSVVVVGDVHGQIAKLDDIVLTLMGTGAQVIFVGDYVDRGESGVEVVDRVRSMVETPEEWGISRAIALRGNHEKMFVDAAEDPCDDAWSGAMSLWLRNGGRIEEFLPLRNRHYGWLKSLPLFYEHPVRVAWREEEMRLVVVHASLKAGVEMERQEEETLVWDRHVTGLSPDHLTVAGHTVCRLRQPEIYTTSSGPVVRIDTGAAYGGPLSAVAFEEV